MADSLSTGREAIAVRQLKHLRSLLGALRPANSFYEKKFVTEDVAEGFASLEDFSLRCPFTTKAELVADQQARFAGAFRANDLQISLSVVFPFFVLLRVPVELRHGGEQVLLLAPRERHLQQQQLQCRPPLSDLRARRNHLQ